MFIFAFQFFVVEKVRCQTQEQLLVVNCRQSVSIGKILFEKPALEDIPSDSTTGLTVIINWK